MGSSSPTKTGAGKATLKIRKQTTKDAADHGKDKKESGLASPTSISMQTSFIIKNADESFDLYH